jgi:hypothetical protein
MIDIIWSAKDYCWDTKKNSEDNVKEGGVKNREIMLRKQNGNRIITAK